MTVHRINLKNSIQLELPNKVTIQSLGHLINKKAFMGSEILSIMDRISQLEKEPKRKLALNTAKAVLFNKSIEWLEVCKALKDEPKLWSMHVNAYLVWNNQTQAFIKA